MNVMQTNHSVNKFFEDIGPIIGCLEIVILTHFAENL